MWHGRAVTFSLLARCPETGQFGAIVASRVLAVGTRVLAARAGVGAAATQAGAWTLWRRNLLDAVELGCSSAQAIDRLAAERNLADAQVAVVSASGAAAFTDAGCTAAAGNLDTEYGARPGREALAPGWVSAQGNTLAGSSVVPALLEGFVRCDGSLLERLVAGLLAGEAEGGDSRGRQSAAVLVVPGQVRISPRHATQHPTGAWDDPFVDLRVDDDPEAVAVLAELTRTHRQHRERIRAGAPQPHEDALRLPD